MEDLAQGYSRKLWSGVAPFHTAKIAEVVMKKTGM
jgi:hypothetical protein